MDDELLECIECGFKFNPIEAEYISEVTSSVRCPHCGRANYWEMEEVEGLHVEDLENQDIIDMEETNEPYVEGFLSKDLEYDSVNRYDVHNQRKIGSAKRNKTYVPNMPMLELRKAIAEILPELEGYNTEEARAVKAKAESLLKKRAFI